MPIPRLTSQRLANQQLVKPRLRAAADLVRWFGAVQAQDYRGSLWAVGQRLAGATEADVEGAIAARAIVRTWPMRGTLHLVPAEDARWMLRLLAPRMIARAAGRHRQLELDEHAFARSRRILARALEGGRRLTRAQAYAALARGGVPPTGQRGIHVLAALAHQGFLCFGPRAGRQPTFVLLEEWVRRSSQPTHDEALATLAARYFQSHGPATVQDFAWWSGLPVKEARRAIGAAGRALQAEAREGTAWWTAARAAEAKGRGAVTALLPPWDEYVVAYRERSFAFGHLRGRAGQPPHPIGNWLAMASGRVCGTWRRDPKRGAVAVRPDLWSPVSPAERAGLLKAARRYAAFLGTELIADR